MAAYCDAEFYSNEYKGTAIPAEALDQALTHASFKVDQATRYRIGELTEWPEFSQRQIKLACCAQAEADYRTEGEQELLRFLDTVGGYSIGDVSVSGKGGGSGTETGGSSLEEHYGLTMKALQFLMPTGLLDRRLR